ncbi:MAG TPA: TIGR04282 family arsenosugar biosynthesis glycosyltransferase [Burkholderiales bacterium]|nr:TIGR04282 family arsenosugar biosynthesis glycosyltransferase [Burkholderiales bacterium]
MAMFPAGPDFSGRIGVAILARAPVPGEAKTRLIPALGAEGAARLQRWLLLRTVAMALAADVGPMSLWCAGDPNHPDFVHCRTFGSVTLHRQPDGDLGTRMLTAARQSPTPAGTLVIGTDCPAMRSAHLQQAARLLRDHDAVTVPAEDGGYVLIGMKTPSTDLFTGIEWGSERVMVQTRQRLAALGWRWSEPITLWDVDHPEDFERLAAFCPEVRDNLSPNLEIA